MEMRADGTLVLEDAVRECDKLEEEEMEMAFDGRVWLPDAPRRAKTDAQRLDEGALVVREKRFKGANTSGAHLAFLRFISSSPVSVHSSAYSIFSQFCCSETYVAFLRACGLWSAALLLALLLGTRSLDVMCAILHVI